MPRTYLSTNCKFVPETTSPQVPDPPAPGNHGFIEGAQNQPPQNVPLWHVDYFEQKASKTLQAQEKLLFLP